VSIKDKPNCTSAGTITSHPYALRHTHVHTHIRAHTHTQGTHTYTATHTYTHQGTRIHIHSGTHTYIHTSQMHTVRRTHTYRNMLRVCVCGQYLAVTTFLNTGDKSWDSTAEAATLERYRDNVSG